MATSQDLIPGMNISIGKRPIKKSQRMPYEGIGKPEHLKHSLSGYWSRRITDEHRIVYKVENDSVLIAQLHYDFSHSSLLQNRFFAFRTGQNTATSPSPNYFHPATL